MSEEDKDHVRLRAIFETLVSDTRNMIRRYPWVEFRTLPAWLFTLQTGNPRDPNTSEWRECGNAGYQFAVTILRELSSDHDEDVPALHEIPEMDVKELDEMDDRDVAKCKVKKDEDKNVEYRNCDYRLATLGWAWLRWSARAGTMEAAAALAYHYAYGVFMFYTSFFAYTLPRRVYLERTSQEPTYALIWAIHLDRLERSRNVLAASTKEVEKTTPAVGAGEYLVFRARVFWKTGSDDSSALSQLVPFVSRGHIPAMLDMLELLGYQHVPWKLKLALWIIDTPYQPCPFIPHVSSIWSRCAYDYISSTVGRMVPGKVDIVEQARTLVRLEEQKFHLEQKLYHWKREARLARQVEAKHRYQVAREWCQEHPDDTLVPECDASCIFETAEAWAILGYHQHAQDHRDYLLQQWACGQIHEDDSHVVVEAAKRSTSGRCISFWLRAPCYSLSWFVCLLDHVADYHLHVCLSDPTPRHYEPVRVEFYVPVILIRPASYKLIDVAKWLLQDPSCVHRRLVTVAYRKKSRIEVLTETCHLLEKQIQMAQSVAYLPAASYATRLQKRFIRTDKQLKEKMEQQSKGE